MRLRGELVRSSGSRTAWGRGEGEERERGLDRARAEGRRGSSAQVATDRRLLGRCGLVGEELPALYVEERWSGVQSIRFRSPSCPSWRAGSDGLCSRCKGLLREWGARAGEPGLHGASRSAVTQSAFAAILLPGAKGVQMSTDQAFVAAIQNHPAIDSLRRDYES